MLPCAAAMHDFAVFVLCWFHELRPSRCFAHQCESTDVWQSLKVYSNCSLWRDKFFIKESGVRWEKSQMPPNGSPHLPQQWPHSINLASSLRYTSQRACQICSVLTRQVEALMTQFDGGSGRANEKVPLLVCLKGQTSAEQHPTWRDGRQIEGKVREEEWRKQEVGASFEFWSLAKPRCHTLDLKYPTDSRKWNGHTPGAASKLDSTWTNKNIGSKSRVQGPLSFFGSSSCI